MSSTVFKMSKSCRSLAHWAGVFRFAAVAVLLGSPTYAQTSHVNWPKFQNGGITSLASGSLPTTWSPNHNLAWKAAIEGYGQSTPIVFDGQIYVTSVSGKQRESYHLTAYSLGSGEKLWQRDFENPTPQENTPMTSRAAPSAIADETGCFAFFEGGIVAAVDRQGATRWQRDLVAEFGPAEGRHGFAASLEHDDQRLFVWVERSDSPYILALDKASGETLWKVEGLGATSWASPRLVTVDDREHLVCSASGKIVGIDPRSGDRLWQITDISNNTSCTPVPLGNNRFLIGASDGRGEQSAGSGARNNGVIEVTRVGSDYAASFIWRAEKATSSFASPVAAAGQACLVNRAGVLYRLDLQTGEPVSVDRVSAGGNWATPIVAGDHLYLFGYKGTTSVVSLKEQKEIATNRLWDEAASDSPGGGRVLYAAAAAPPYLILRSGDMLYAIKESKP